MTKIKFQIKEMHCTGCAMTVEGALEDLTGVKSANANYAQQTAEVEYDENQVNERQLKDAIVQAGYGVA